MWLSNAPDDPIYGPLLRNDDAEAITTRTNKTLVATSILVLIHSYVLHGRKIDSVRISTDVAAIIGFISGVLYLYIAGNPTTLNRIVGYNIFYNGIFYCIIQLCDTYMFFNRYCVVVKVSYRVKLAIQLYMWLVMQVAWLVFYTVGPFFYPCNTPFLKYFILLWQTTTSIVFYILFTAAFLRVLMRIPGKVWTSSFKSMGGIGRNPTSAGDLANSSVAMSALRTIRIIAIKSILHCITSVAANHNSAPGTQFILWILGMHIWFNMKIEDTFTACFLCCFPKRKKQNRKKKKPKLQVEPKRDIQALNGDLSALQPAQIPVQQQQQEQQILIGQQEETQQQQSPRKPQDRLVIIAQQREQGINNDNNNQPILPPSSLAVEPPVWASNQEQGGATGIGLERMREVYVGGGRVNSRIHLDLEDGKSDEEEDDEDYDTAASNKAVAAERPQVVMHIDDALAMMDMEERMSSAMVPHAQIRPLEHVDAPNTPSAMMMNDAMTAMSPSWKNPFARSSVASRKL